MLNEKVHVLVFINYWIEKCGVKHWNSKSVIFLWIVRLKRFIIIIIIINCKSVDTRWECATMQDSTIQYGTIQYNISEYFTTCCRKPYGIFFYNEWSFDPVIYTGCPRRKGPNFGRVFLRSNYTDITQNTYIQSSMVTEILNIELWI